MKTDSKLYEIAFLLKDPEGEKDLVQIIAQHNGTIKVQQPAKAIRLAYPITKHTSAYFGFMHCDLPASAIESIDRTLKLNKNVIRFLIVIPPLIKASKTERKSDGRRLVKKVASTKSLLTNDVLEEKLAALENESK
ncbi:MAG TPA: 30S ribosomal protein S6 [Candidatus Paceibacterota bacterium]